MKKLLSWTLAILMRLSLCGAALDPQRTEYATNDFLVYLLVDNLYWDTVFDRSMVPKDVRERFVSIGMNGGQNVLEGYTVASTETIGGFIYEALIPWQCFSNENIPVYTSAVGNSVSFDFAITDIFYPCPGTQNSPNGLDGNGGYQYRPQSLGPTAFPVILAVTAE